nr:PREDICTED: sulfotransferase 1C2-like [Latimeria chalumnae]|eukprot:XP_014339992.1 PREDICTED: sulfotransferase 1C2-like [Latimeria chalumnae]
MFRKGNVVSGSWFDHVLSWENHTNLGNVLILYYESMKKDLPKSIRQISKFLGKNVSDTEINGISKKLCFTEMKEKAEKENTDANHTVCVLTSNRKLIFRKGTVGDWKNYFTSKQNRQFDEIFKEKMSSSDLAKCIVYEC